MGDPRHSLYIYAYDLSNDRERQRLDKLLSGYGFRRQKSVFLCRLTRSARRRLDEAIAAMELKSGFVIAAPLAPQGRITTFGAHPPPDPDGGYCFIV